MFLHLWRKVSIEGKLVYQVIFIVAIFQVELHKLVHVLRCQLADESLPVLHIVFVKVIFVAIEETDEQSLVLIILDVEALFHFLA